MSENRRPPTMDTSPFSSTFPSNTFPNLPTNNTLSTPKPTKPKQKHVDFAALSLTGGRKARKSKMGGKEGTIGTTRAMGEGKGDKGGRGGTGGGKRRVSVPMATRRSNVALSSEEEGEDNMGMDVDVDVDEEEGRNKNERGWEKERTHLAVEVDTQRMQLISPPPEEVLVLERGRSVSGHGHGRRESTTNVYPYAPNTLNTPGRSPGAALTSASLRLHAAGSSNASLDATAANRNASNTGSGSSKRKRPQPATAAAAFITPSSSRSSKGSTSPEAEEEEEEDASMTIDGGHEYEQQQYHEQQHQEQQEPVEATPNPKPRKQGRLARIPSMAGSPTKGSFASGEMVPRSPMGMDKAKAPTTPTKLKAKRVVVQSPHVTNPDADYIPPVALSEDEQEPQLKNPSVRRAVLSSRGSRRSATPIPPYEPPTDVFTPPREVFMSPLSAAPRRSSRKSTAASAKKKKGKGLSVNTLILQTQVVKQEIPDDIDLSAPMPPASPTDDPLLLSGPPEPEPELGAVLDQEEEEGVVVRVQRRSVEVQVQMQIQAPDLPPSSPDPPLDTDDAEAVGAFDWHRAGDASIESESSSMMLDDPADADVEPVRLFDFALGDPSGWSDSDDEQGAGAGAGAGNVDKGAAALESEGEGEGEYTGRWRTLKVPTKQDPPSSATRGRMEDWGRPISPFPYKRERAMPLIGEEELEEEQELEEEEVRRMSVEPELELEVRGQQQQHQQREEEAREEEEEEVRRMSVEPEPERDPVPEYQDPVPEIVQVQDASPEDEDDESSDAEDDPGLVKITSADPRAAARAVAILKQHDYECYTKLVKRRRVSLGDMARDSRRKSLAAHGISKNTNKPRSQSQSRRSMGVIGERVYIPGSPVVTLPELLEQVEKDVVGEHQHQQEVQVWKERRERKERVGDVEVYETPRPAGSRSAGATANVFDADLDSSRHLSALPTSFLTPINITFPPGQDQGGPRPWTKEAWKLLDACFTDVRLELNQDTDTDGSELADVPDRALADVEKVRVEDVVDRFVGLVEGMVGEGGQGQGQGRGVLEEKGQGVLEGWGEEWDRESLLQRAEALKKKQRAGRVAPPTTPGVYTPVMARTSGSLAFASPRPPCRPTSFAFAVTPVPVPAKERRTRPGRAEEVDVPDFTPLPHRTLASLSRGRAPPPPRRSLLGPGSRPPVLPPAKEKEEGLFQDLGPEDEQEEERRMERKMERRMERKRLPGSLLAPRYSHLLEEARAVSESLGGGKKELREREEEEEEEETEERRGEEREGEGEDTSVDDRHEGNETSQEVSASFSSNDDDDQHSDEEEDEPTLHAQPRSTHPAQPTTISTRVKGFLFSYLPTLSSSTLAAKSKSLKPINKHPRGGLPLPPPPPSLLTKQRKPVQTPAKPAPARGPVPKELVNLNNVPLPQPKVVGVGRKREPPRRLVELAPVPQEVLDKTVNVLGAKEREKRGRRSSGSSVRDLIKGFEEMEREQKGKGKVGVGGKGMSEVRRAWKAGAPDTRPRWRF